MRRTAALSHEAQGKIILQGLFKGPAFLLFYVGVVVSIGLCMPQASFQGMSKFCPNPDIGGLLSVAVSCTLDQSSLLYRTVSLVVVVTTSSRSFTCPLT